MAVQLTGVMVLLQTSTNCSILAISSLKLQKLPLLIASCVMIPNKLHLVQPGGVDGRVMDEEAGPLSQPGTHIGVLVGAVVGHDPMHIQGVRHGILDLP